MFFCHITTGTVRLNPSTDPVRVTQQRRALAAVTIPPDDVRRSDQ